MNSFFERSNFHFIVRKNLAYILALQDRFPPDSASVALAKSVMEAFFMRLA